ncbi:MAG: cytochrome c [Rhodothermales bacterium]
MNTLLVRCTVAGLAAAGAALLVGMSAVHPRDAGHVAPDGEEVYMHNCMDCHQDGTGTPDTAPPLDGAPWVQGEPERLVRIVLHGLVGEVVVDGTTYNGVMPGWRNLLDDEEIAAVLSYIRSSWSNDAARITPAEVAAIRAATADRTQPWTVEELED